MPHLPTALHLRPDQIGALALGLVATAGVAAYLLYHRRPDPDEIERLRREFLTTEGRITDATLVDIGLDRRGELPQVEAQAPDVLHYQYKVGGVGYESIQDVARLADYVRHVRVDLPVQVRYDPKNPGNSIVVSESWSGLRVGAGTGVSATVGKGLQERLRGRE